jgi:histidinol-phosphate aminotransferase
VLVEVGSNADELAAMLLQGGVSVQSGVPFGAPTSLRVTAGSAAQLDRLDAALGTALDTR